MPTISIDFTADLKAYPYVAPKSSATAVPIGSTSSSALDQFADFLQTVDIPTDIQTVIKLGAITSTSSDQWAPLLVPNLDRLKGFFSFLSKGLDKLNKIAIILNKILRIMNLFINTFNSFSSLLASVANFAKQTVGNLISDSLNFGVYMNVIVPPAFLEENANNIENLQKSRGGFSAFITRLKASLNNTEDKNRPTFKEVDYVGGMVIVIDSAKIDEIWMGLKQLAALFNLKNFKLSFFPPPPGNLQGFSSYFINETSKEPIKKFGIQIEWDNNFLCSAYKISRSTKPGGTAQIVPYYPDSLVDDPDTGDPGLISIAKQKFLSIFTHEAVTLPEKVQNVYVDPNFYGGKPVIVQNSLAKSLKYIDYDVSKDTIGQLYYVIQSCGEDGSGAGAYSNELSVTVRACNNMYELADIIEQPNGSIEYLAAGFGGINSWTSLQISALIPWYKDLIGLMNNLIDKISTTTANVTSSFAAFLNDMAAKVQTILSIVNVLTYIIVSMKNLVLGPSVLMLTLDPKQGGMNRFVERIQNASLPPGDPGFSGPEGFTLGFVIAYGSPGIVLGDGDPGKVAANAMKKAFDFLTGLFKKS